MQTQQQTQTQTKAKPMAQLLRSFQDHIGADGPVSPGTPARFTEACQPGDRICQGDVEITLISKVPDNYVPRSNHNTNIVHGEAGNETHKVDDPTKVRFYDTKGWDADSLDGPVIEVLSPTGISHTGSGRHGHVGLCSGLYQISYPRVWETEQAKERRARD